MDDFIKHAQESTERVLGFYDKVGTPLSYTPKIEYKDSLFQSDRNIIARIKEENEILENYLSFFSRSFAKAVWKGAYNLDVSDEAILELEDIQKRRIGNVFRFEEHESDADIILYRPFRSYHQYPEESDEVFSHEIWHLIEKERGVMQAHPFIAEGTATYAMRRYFGKACDKSLEECIELNGMMYFGAANIVQNHVKGSENPYKEMLKKEVREGIQQDLVKRVEPVLVKATMASLQNEDAIEMISSSIRQIPEFEALEGNLTKEGIIEAYNQMGASQLVSELKGKDLEGLMMWFRRFGF